MNWLMTILGLTDPGGPWYLWWSGFFPDITVFAAAATLYLRHNCHTRYCWRVGRHHNGTQLYCRKHHVKERNDAIGS